MIRQFSLTALATLALAGCQQTGAEVARLVEAPPGQSIEAGPPGAAPGTCWGKRTTPAVIETVTEQVLLQPAQVTSDGNVLQPALYKTETHQRIVTERRELWFETPCDEVMDAEFIASLQRALAVRGVYSGPINGEMTRATRHAIRNYQQPLGLDSAILSLQAARRLGLVAYPRPATPSDGT